MPSCVVKGCKNNSQKQKRSDGMSFHRFPLEADIRSEWIAIVRKNRLDKSWRPSNFCIICSEHFAEEDMYFTKQGRRCIKKEAKPTLKLRNHSGKEPHFTTVDVSSVIEGEKEAGRDDTLNNGSIKKEDTIEDSELGNKNAMEIASDNEPIEKKSIKQETAKKKRIKEETDDEEKSLSAYKEKSPTKKELKHRKSVNNSDYEDSDSDLANYSRNREVASLKRKLSKEKMLRSGAKKKLKIMQQKVRRLSRRNAMLKRTVLKLKYNKGLEKNDKESKEIKFMEEDDSNYEADE